MFERIAIVAAVFALLLVPWVGLAGPDERVADPDARPDPDAVRHERTTVRTPGARFDLRNLTLTTRENAGALPKRVRDDRARLRKAKKAPPPMPVADRSRVVKHVRGLAKEWGVRLAPMPCTLAAPPSQIVLTPDKPRVGASFLGVRFGHSQPRGYSVHDRTPALDLASNGYYIVHFEPLVIGGVYVIDCTVEDTANRKWSFGHPLNVHTSPQQGHVLAAFVATKGAMKTHLVPDKLFRVRLYRCELIRAG